MKVSSISIRNFRSISKMNINCKDFNIFVGQNNSGKTNFFEAVDWFFKGSTKGKSIKHLHPDNDTSKEITVEIVFSDAQHGAQNMINEKKRKTILKALNNHDEITVKRSSSSSNVRQIIIDGEPTSTNLTGLDLALNDFLPKFEYIHTKQYFDEVAKYSSKSPVGIMLSSVLETILQDNLQYRNFLNKFDELFEGESSLVKLEFDKLGDTVKTHLEKQFSECTKVGFEVESPVFDELLKKFQTRVDDGIETYAHEKGDGMQRALMLAIIQAYAEYRKEKNDKGKSFLFFIDEAELHLHPTAQRKLKDVLLELCANLDQIFINTHSSVFIADDHSKQIIHQVVKDENITLFTETSELDKPYIVFELLGGSPADLLLPRNFLIVEGASEIEFLTRVIKRLYSDKPAIHIVAANGDTHQASRSVNAISKLYEPLKESIYKERLVIICDKPTVKAKGGYDDFCRTHNSLVLNNQIITLPKESIEEYYPNKKNWQRSNLQVKKLSGRQKKKLAINVGENITKADFENDMSMILRALEKAWTEAL